MIRDRLRRVLGKLPKVAWDASSNGIVFVPKEEVKAEAERLVGHKQVELPESAAVGDDTTRSKASRGSRPKRR